MEKIKLKKKRLIRRKLHIKKKIRSNTERLRLCISKSNSNFYVQVIDDTKNKTLLGLSTLAAEFKEVKSKGNIESAKLLGKFLAQKALEKGIKKVVFDRNGYLYHGKIKAFADSARENGLEF